MSFETKREFYTPIGTAKMLDGRPVILVALPTGVIIPLVNGAEPVKK